MNNCFAKCNNGFLCKRKSRIGYNYCGTHLRNLDINIKNTMQKMKSLIVWPHEINGIYYFIDDEYNIYSTLDICINSNQPRIIGKLELS